MGRFSSVIFLQVLHEPLQGRIRCQGLSKLVANSTTLEVAGVTQTWPGATSVLTFSPCSFYGVSFVEPLVQTQRNCCHRALYFHQWTRRVRGENHWGIGYSYMQKHQPSSSFSWKKNPCWFLKNSFVKSSPREYVFLLTLYTVTHLTKAPTVAVLSAVSMNWRSLCSLSRVVTLPYIIYWCLQRIPIALLPHFENEGNIQPVHN